jgi:pantoate--beta-alanine ligase
MGYLHGGHLALVKTSQAQNTSTAVSIFVNPTQFNQVADLQAYPRDEARDLELLAGAGVSAVFLPSVEAIYPPAFQTYVSVERVSQGLEGAHRPQHFRGVATVVAKFFNLLQPTRAYFGAKDAQQVAVIRQMVEDLAFPLEVVVCPTVRAEDGLALSSRNARLSPTERQAAPVIYRALQAVQAHYQAGERQPRVLREIAQAVLQEEARARLEYVSVADAQTLEELETERPVPYLVSLAVFIGEVRLIDNVVLV